MLPLEFNRLRFVKPPQSGSMIGTRAHILKKGTMPPRMNRVPYDMNMRQ